MAPEQTVFIFWPGRIVFSCGNARGIWRGWEEIGRKGAARVQEIINKSLEVSKETNTFSVLTMSESLRFSSYTPAKADLVEIS